MGRIARLEQRLAELEDAFRNLTFTSDAPVVNVEVPVPVIDNNGVPTGGITTGYLPVKTGPTSGKIVVGKSGVATLQAT